MFKIEYSPLNFYNSMFSQECLCVGVLFHNLTNGRRDFKTITNFKRFKSFNDEIDPEFIKLYLSGIKEEIEDSLYNEREFSISDYIQVYVNELRFSQPRILAFDEKEDYVDILTKMYLKFDFKKSKRLSQNEEIENLKKILKGSDLNFLNPNVVGPYDDGVKFDYLTDNFAIKLFSFKDKDLRKLVPTMKQWAFTAEEFKDKYNILFLYDESIKNEPESKTILSILSKNAKVLPYAEGFDYITQSN